MRSYNSQISPLLSRALEGWLRLLLDWRSATRGFSLSSLFSFFSFLFSNLNLNIWSATRVFFSFSSISRLLKIFMMLDILFSLKERTLRKMWRCSPSWIPFSPQRGDGWFETWWWLVQRRLVDLNHFKLINICDNCNILEINWSIIRLCLLCLSSGRWLYIPVTISFLIQHDDDWCQSFTHFY